MFLFLGDFMYEKLSIKISNLLIRHGFISINDADIYIYSFQIIVSTLVSSIFIIFWALLFNQPINTVLFFIGFFLCRKFSGGYHAKSQITCFVLTQLIFIAFLALITFSNITENKNYIFLISFLANIIIFFFAPVDNENKPLDDAEKIKFRKQSRFFILVNIMFLLFSLYIPVFFHKYICYILGVSAISLMLVLGKFKNIATLNSKNKKKGGKYNE